MIQKKRHHYIPIAYLDRFTDFSDRVFAYRKDDARTPLHVRPNEIAFERYYYSQPLPDGGRDNNRLEDFFGTYESSWPDLVYRLQTRSNLAADFAALLGFMIVMRVRVPATRDMVELLLAEQVKLQTRSLDKRGLLPPKPAGHEDILDHMSVSIDPCKSLEAMPSLGQGFARVLSCMEFEVLHNETDISILTSDNPVICFNPHVPETDVLPYQIVPPNGPMELIFPVSPTLIVRGRAGQSSLRHNVLVDNRPVERINRFVSRFGYRFVFAADRSHDAIIETNARNSPVPDFAQMQSQKGEGVQVRWVFGTRPMKPKWVAPSGERAA